MTFHVEFHMAISYRLQDLFGYHCLRKEYLDLPTPLYSGFSATNIWVINRLISYLRLHPLLLQSYLKPNQLFFIPDMFLLVEMKTLKIT